MPRSPRPRERMQKFCRVQDFSGARTELPTLECELTTGSGRGCPDERVTGATHDDDPGPAERLAALDRIDDVHLTGIIVCFVVRFVCPQRAIARALTPPIRAYRSRTGEVPLTRYIRDEFRICRSAYSSAATLTQVPKLTVRVRFSSPTPESLCCTTVLMPVENLRPAYRGPLSPAFCLYSAHVWPTTILVQTCQRAFPPFILRPTARGPADPVAIFRESPLRSMLAWPQEGSRDLGQHRAASGSRTLDLRAMSRPAMVFVDTGEHIIPGQRHDQIFPALRGRPQIRPGGTQNGTQAGTLSDIPLDLYSLHQAQPWSAGGSCRVVVRQTPP